MQAIRWQATATEMVLPSYSVKVRMKYKKIQRNKTGKNVRQQSETKTHKVQSLHAAVLGHSICDFPGPVVANFVMAL